MNVDCAWSPMKACICYVNRDEPEQCPYYKTKCEKCEYEPERIEVCNDWKLP